MRPLAIPSMAAALLLVLLPTACDNMQHQENVRAFEPSKVFADGSSARTPPAHTVSRDAAGPNDVRSTGMKGGQWLKGFPMTLDRDFVVHGGERYAIFCADCHGADGAGLGIVVARGFPRPKSFHDESVRQEPEGALFAAVSRGRGVMYGFADRVGTDDRWAIVAYIRALQRSRDARLADVPLGERELLSAP
jgi:mono/diheme cytochrome c family protein